MMAVSNGGWAVEAMENREFAEWVRKEFVRYMDQKTSWGRVQVMNFFDLAVNRVLRAEREDLELKVYKVSSGE